MTTPPISVQLYTLRERVAADLPGTLRELADIGFTAVEPHRWHEDVAGMRRALADAGLVAPSAHARLLQAADGGASGGGDASGSDDVRMEIGPDAEAMLDAAAELGITTVVQPVSPPEVWRSAAGVAQLAEQLGEVAALAARHGLQVAYHNHAWELEESTWHTDPDRSVLEVFADDLDPKVVLEVDTYWAAVGGLDPLALLQRLGTRAALLHIKDGPISAVNTDQLPVGQGVMPVTDLLAVAPHARPIIELDDYSGDMLDAVRQSFTYLSGVLS